MHGDDAVVMRVMRITTADGTNRGRRRFDMMDAWAAISGP
jgi:hypothetical protein